MAKQKKVWKSVALEKSNRSAADKIRDVLLTVAKGYHDAIDDAGQLHGSWGGLAVIPGEDSFTIVEEAK